MNYTLYNITDKKSGKIVVPGIYSGNYGHFFCSYLPWLAKYREEHPDDIIIGAGDYIFHQYAKRYCDYYYGYQHPWDTDSPPSAPFESIMNFKEVVEKDFGPIDTYVDLLIPGEVAHNVFMDAVNTNIRILRQLPYDRKSKIIVLWPRYKKAAEWRNGNLEHWHRTALALQQKGFTVYCTGKVEIEGLTYVSGITLQMARCILMDQSGVFNETLFLGCPTLIFNSDPHHLPKIKKRNIFQTKLEFYEPKKWDHWTQNPLDYSDLSYMDGWIKAVEMFIKSCETDRPFLKDIANHSGVFNRR